MDSKTPHLPGGGDAAGCKEYVAYVAEQPSTSSAATEPEPQQPGGGDEADGEPYNPDDDDDWEDAVLAPLTEEERAEAWRAEAEQEYMDEQQQPGQYSFGSDNGESHGGEPPSDSLSDSDSELEIIANLAKRKAPSESPDYDDSDSSDDDE